MPRFHVSSLLKGIQQDPKPPIVHSVTKKKGGRQPKKQPELKTQPKPPAIGKKKRKKPIPAALREQVWIHKMGRAFEGKCPVTWCQNTITVFDFQSGHNIPESRGGKTDLENLIPVCSRCNLSMGNEYTIDEWSKISDLPVKTVVEVPKPKKKWWCW